MLAAGAKTDGPSSGWTQNYFGFFLQFEQKSIKEKKKKIKRVKNKIGNILKYFLKNILR
jgi:hypothetical protein